MTRSAFKAAAVLGGVLLVTTACSTTSERPLSDAVAESAGSGLDRTRLIVECLEGEGWDVEIDPLDGGISPGSLPSEQAEVYLADADDCSTKYPYVEPERTREAAEAYYDALIETQACLAELGFDAADLVSKEASVESMLTGEVIDPLWDPYDAVSEQSVDFGGSIEVGVQDALRECPQPSFS